MAEHVSSPKYIKDHRGVSILQHDDGRYVLVLLDVARDGMARVARKPPQCQIFPLGISLDSVVRWIELLSDNERELYYDMDALKGYELLKIKRG